MGFVDLIKDQFIDVIENSVDMSNRIVTKYERNTTNNEIKQGSKLIVRESQVAVFINHGRLGDIFQPGTYELNTDNLPILSTLEAWKFGFISPIVSDLYFISTKNLTDNRWGTKNPFIVKDEQFGIVRIRAFGSFAFRVSDAFLFMQEVFGTQSIMTSDDMINFVSSILMESIVDTIAEMNLPIITLASNLREIGTTTLAIANEKLEPMGLTFTTINVENISLPEEVEKYIDEQSGINLASGNMDNFQRWNQTKALRDAAQQENGFAGIGAGFGFGAQMMQNSGMASQNQQTQQIVKIKCPSCGSLNDEFAKFCIECGYSLMKVQVCPNCGKELEAGIKFCGECGTKIG